MAPLYPLEDNVNKTEECRYNLDLTLDSLFSLYSGNTMLNDALSISSLTLQPDHNLINSETDTPLVDIVNACKKYSIINSPVYTQYPIYLYYTYCGYSRYGENVEPCIGYTSNKTFLNKLNIDKQFFDYINFNFTPFNINDLTAGLATYKFKISNALSLTDPNNTFYYKFNPTDWTANYCPGKGREGNFYFEENSFTPPPLDSYKKTVSQCTSNTVKDLLIRFPYYPCSILYKQSSEDAILYSPMNPIREIFVTQNSGTFDISKLANTDNLSSFSKLLVDSRYWKKDYITDDNTDIIVCTQVPEEGVPAIATYFDYVSSASEIATAVNNGIDIQPFKFDSRYFNDNDYTKPIEKGQYWGTAADYKKDMPYCQLSANLTYKKDGMSITRLAYIPPMLSPARVEDAKKNDIKYTCRIYYTGHGNLGSYFETLGCTPLARRQPVLVIDDDGLFEKEYTYALKSANRATNTNIAHKLNNVIANKFYNNSLTNVTTHKTSNTGEAINDELVFTLNKGLYKILLIGGGSDGASVRYYNSTQCMSGSSGATVWGIVNILQDNTKCKLIRGGNGAFPGRYFHGCPTSKDAFFSYSSGLQYSFIQNKLNNNHQYYLSLPICGYGSSCNSGGDSKFQVLVGNEWKDVLIAQGGQAGWYSVDSGCTNLNTEQSPYVWCNKTHSSNEELQVVLGNTYDNPNIVAKFYNTTSNSVYGTARNNSGVYSCVRKLGTGGIGSKIDSIDGIVKVEKFCKEDGINSKITGLYTGSWDHNYKTIGPRYNKIYTDNKDIINTIYEIPIPNIYRGNGIFEKSNLLKVGRGSAFTTLDDRYALNYNQHFIHSYVGDNTEGGYYDLLTGQNIGGREELWMSTHTGGPGANNTEACDTLLDGQLRLARSTAGLAYIEQVYYIP